MPPSVVNNNNKSGSVSHDRMSSTDDPGVKKVKMFDPPTDDDDNGVQPDHHKNKKPPVPMRRTSGRKTWNQRDETSPSPVSNLLRKTRSELMGSKSMVIVGGDGKPESTSTSPRLLRKVKSTPPRSEQVSKLSNESGVGTVKIGKIQKMGGILIDNDLNGSDDNCEETKLITSNVDANGCSDAIENEESDEMDKKVMEDEEIEVELKSCDVKEVSIPDKKLSNNEDEDVKVCPSPDKTAIAAQSALVVKQPPPRYYVKRSAFYSDLNKSSHCITKAANNVVKPGPKFTKPNPSFSAPAPGIPHPDEFQRHSATQDRMQSLVDLVMWRDVSRSTFVFGTGIFMIISSSYTQDINISFVSVASYLGLAYLALIFIIRSVLHKGVRYMDNNIVVGEDEAIWIVKLVLPYVNEFFLTLKALFSGDPATTMKLAVVLFILAKCGSSITILKMSKLGFIGVFTVPKLFALYSLQLKSQCNFWMERFRDAWGTCSHKKIIAGIIFSLVWNLCSVVARIWALFMMAVAFRYYQQLMAEQEEENVDEPLKEQGGRVEEMSMESSKAKKGM